MKFRCKEDTLLGLIFLRWNLYLLLCARDFFDLTLVCMTELLWSKGFWCVLVITVPVWFRK